MGKTRTRTRRVHARSPLLVLLAGALIAGLISGSALAATSGSSSTEVEHSVALTSPGVVFIDTSVSLKVVLTYRNSANVSGLGHLNDSYAFDYATGSGFVVNPNGVVVTASHVVEPDQQSMRNYAANRLVLEGYGYSYPTANSSPFDQYTLPVNYENVLLHQCYKAIACDFTITPIVTVFSTVDIARTQLPEGQPARILNSTGFENTDVAILQVNGSNMPTEALAQTAGDLASGAEITALGFPGTSRDNLETGVTEPNKVFGHVSNVRDDGTSKLVEVDASIQPGMSGGPVIDDRGQVIGLISFALLQSSGEAGAKYLRTVDDIRTSLSDAGVTAQRGPVDAAFGKAMSLYWGHHYSASIPEFNRVLALYDGHPLAKQYLAEAQAKKGTAADIPVSHPSKGIKGLPIWLIAAGAGGVLLVVILLVVITSRKRKRPGPPATPAMPVPAMLPQAVPTAPVAPLPVAEPVRSVGFQPSPPPGNPDGSAPQGAIVGSSQNAQAAEAPAGIGRVEVATANGLASSFCSSCGQGLLDNAHFCPNCGVRVGD